MVCLTFPNYLLITPLQNRWSMCSSFPYGVSFRDVINFRGSGILILRTETMQLITSIRSVTYFKLSSEWIRCSHQLVLQVRKQNPNYPICLKSRILCITVSFLDQSRSPPHSNFSYPQVLINPPEMGNTEPKNAITRG